MSLKEKLLAKRSELKTIKVDIDGETAYVREMTAAQRADIDAKLYGSGQLTAKKYAENRFREVICCVCNEDGTPVFTENDMQAVQDMPLHTFQLLHKAVREVNGDIDKEAEKNSTTPTSD